MRTAAGRALIAVLASARIGPPDLPHPELRPLSVASGTGSHEAFGLDQEDSLLQAGGLVVRASHERDAFMLALYGELDIASARVLERKVQMATASAAQRLVIDLSGLQFMDSAGLHALIRAQAHIHAEGRDLSVLRGPRAVQRVFELTQADRVFHFEG